MKFAAIAVASVLAFSGQAFAASDTNRTIVNLGSTSTGYTGYVQVAEGFSQTCKFSLVYLPDQSQPNAKAMMAVLISAQARHAPVTITYDVDASGTCIANLVAAQ